MGGTLKQNGRADNERRRSSECLIGKKNKETNGDFRGLCYHPRAINCPGKS